MAASLTPILIDKYFRNWIKGALAVLFARQGLTDFVLNEITDLQNDLLNHVWKVIGIPAGTTCNACTTANLLVCPTHGFCTKGKKCTVHNPKISNLKPNQPCPHNLCTALRDAILKEHRYRGPSWRNTDARGWCTDAYQLAKCYMPPDGYADKASLTETDFNGVIAVVINNKRFEKKLSVNFSSKTNICEQARIAGREIRHSATHQLSDTDLVSYIDVFIQLLSDHVYLVNDAKAMDAVQKLKQLKANTLTIHADDITSVLNDSIKATFNDQQNALIREIQEHFNVHKKDSVEAIDLKVQEFIETGKVELSAQTERGKDEINSKVKKGKGELSAQTEQVKDELNSKVEKGKGELSVQIEQGKDELNSKVEKGKGELSVQIEQGKDELHSKVEKGKGKLSVQTEQGKDELSLKVEKGKGELSVQSEKGKDELCLKVEKGKVELNAKTEQGLDELHAQTREGAAKLKVQTSDGKDELSSHIAMGKHEVEAKTNQGKEEIEAHGKQVLDKISRSAVLKSGNNDDSLLQGTNLPAEILRMDNNAIKLYQKALNDGEEKVYNIRLMVVGHFGVGKTALTKRLLNQHIDIAKRNPTEGIDVHVGKMAINLKNGEWSEKTKDAEMDYFSQRKGVVVAHHVDDSSDSSDTCFSKTESSDDEPDESEQRPKDNILPSTTQNKLSVTPEARTETFSVIQDNMVTLSKYSQNDDQIVHHVQDDDQKSPKHHDSNADAQENETREELKKIISNPNLDKLLAELSIWDFAGQYAFYDTHQVFMSWRTIYLLVTDLSKTPTDTVEDDDCYVDCIGKRQWKVSEFASFWLNAINECSGVDEETANISYKTPEMSNEKVKSSTGPPIILVGTFADKLKDQNEADERFEKLKGSLKTRNCRNSNLVDTHIAIDNTSTQKEDGLNKLKETILDIAKKQKYWGERKPARWIEMEIKLHEMKTSGTKILEKRYLEKQINDKILPIPSLDELNLFLKFHHETGNLIHFSEENTLSETIVLEPQWLIDMFKQLNPQCEFFTEKSKTFDKWVDYDKYGILPTSLIDEMWRTTNNDTYTLEPNIHGDNTNKTIQETFSEQILGYLEKLGLLAKPHEDIIKKNTLNELFYFAPSFLKEAIPDRFLIPGNDEKTTSKLCFTTKSGFLPSAVFNRLLASCIAKYRVKSGDIPSKYLLFCGCGVFQFDDDFTLFVFYRENEIQIWLSSYTLDKVKEVCERAKTLVEGMINRKDLKYYLKCPQTSVILEDGGLTIEYNSGETIAKEEFTCKITVFPKQLTQFWFPDDSSSHHKTDNDMEAIKVCEKKGFNKDCRYNGRLVELEQDEKDKIAENCGGNTIFGALRKVQELKSEGFAIEVAIRRVHVVAKIQQEYVRRKINSSRYRHPFIVPTYAIFEKKNVFYFISPYCKNGTLEAALHQPDPSHRTNECCCTLLSVANRIRIAFQVSSAILYLRENGLEHGGISSKNIVLDEDLNARLIDFKLSKDIKDTTSSPNSGRSPSAEEDDQANPDSKCDDTAKCNETDFADFRRVVGELMCYCFKDTSNKNSIDAKQTIDDVVECLKYTITTNDFKANVVCKLKKLLVCNYSQNLIRGSGNQRVQKCVVCLINPAAPNDIVRPCCLEPMATCLACIYASYPLSLRCFSCEATVKTIGDNWGALLISGKGVGTQADAQASVFQNDAKAIKGVLESKAIGLREENVVEIHSNNTADFLPQLRTAVERFTCQCSDECNKVNVVPTTMLIYFSGHGKISECENPQSQVTAQSENSKREDGKKNNVFVIGSNDITLEQLTEELQKMKQVDTFVIILDRCYPPFITIENKTVIQINASGPANVSKLTMKGSKFTKYFIQAFTGKCQNNCKICENFANNGNDYVTISHMHDYILKHFENEYEEQRPCINIQGPKPTSYIAFKGRSTSECDIDGLLKTLDRIPLETGQT